MLSVRDQFANTVSDTLSYTVVPGKPQKVRKKGGECNTLSWQAVEGADRYVVFRDTLKIEADVTDRESLSSLLWKEVEESEVEDCMENIETPPNGYAVAAVNSKGQFGKLAVPGNDTIPWKTILISAGSAVAASCIANFVICTKPGTLSSPPGYPGNP